MGDLEGVFLWCSLLAGFPMQLTPVSTEKQDQRYPRPPSHASLSLLQEELTQQLETLQTRTKQTLLSALPGVTVSLQQVGMGWLRPP